MGYQIIDVPRINDLYGNPKHFEFAVASLSWLAARLRSEIGDLARDIEIDVIRAEYYGAYPTLGVRYNKLDTAENVEPHLQSLIISILEQTTLEEFLAFVAASSSPWAEITATIMRQPRD